MNPRGGGWIWALLLIACEKEHIQLPDGGPVAVETPDARPAIEVKDSAAAATVFADARDFAGGAAAVARKAGDKLRWGFAGKDGRWLVAPEWDDVTDWAAGRAWGRRGDRWSLVLERGATPALPLVVTHVEQSGALTAVRSGGRWGFIGVHGNIVAAPRYYNVDRFGPDRFWARDERWTLFSPAGAGPSYDRLDTIRQTVLARVSARGKACLVGENGTCLFDGSPKIRWVGDVGIVNAGGRRGVVTRDGRRLLPARYDDLRPTPGALFLLKQGDLWGLIDQEGKEVIPPRFDEVSSFVGGAARVRENELWGFLLADGRLIEPAWQDVDDAGDGMAPVERGDKWGYIALADGRQVIEPRYDRATPFREQRGAVRLAGRWGLVDTRGNVVVPPRWDDIRPVSGGMAAFRDEPGWGIMDRDGAILIGPVYDEMGPVDGGAAIVARRGEKLCISATARRAVLLKYDEVGEMNNGQAMVRRGSCGYLDNTCRLAIPLEYDECHDFNAHGVALVRAGNQYRLIAAGNVRRWTSQSPIVEQPDGTFLVGGEPIVRLAPDARPPLRDGWRRERLEDGWRFVSAAGAPLILPRTW